MLFFVSDKVDAKNMYITQNLQGFFFHKCGVKVSFRIRKTSDFPAIFIRLAGNYEHIFKNKTNLLYCQLKALSSVLPVAGAASYEFLSLGRLIARYGSFYFSYYFEKKLFSTLLAFFISNMYETFL